MRCPRCPATLDAQPAGRKAKLRACPEHHGVFATPADLQHVLPVSAYAALRDAMDRSVPGALACPSCATATMRTLHPRGVELDGCPDCGGVWFDGGELERVKEQPKGPLSSPATPQGRPQHAMGFAGDAAGAAIAGPEIFAGIFQIIASLLDGW